MPRSAKDTAEQIARGQRAAQILEDPVFLEIMEAVETTIFAKWGATKIDQKDERDWLYMQGVAQKSLRQGLRAYAETGKMLLMSLEQMNAAEARSRGRERAPR